MPFSELSVVDGPGTRPLAARDRALPPRGVRMATQYTCLSRVRNRRNDAQMLTATISSSRLALDTRARPRLSAQDTATKN